MTLNKKFLGGNFQKLCFIYLSIYLFIVQRAIPLLINKNIVCCNIIIATDVYYAIYIEVLAIAFVKRQ